MSELAAGNIQGAAEAIATGLVGVALPFVGALFQPLNTLVAVVNQLPNIVLAGGLAVIGPPLALVQATGQALQGIVDAATSGDSLGVINAIVNVPAVMLDGFVNGYAPTQTGGLLTPGFGTFSILVNLRDLLVTAITPAPMAATTTTAATAEVTSTKTAAKVVTLNVAPQGTDATATDNSSSTTATDATEGKAADTKEAAATDAAAPTETKDETPSKTTTSTTISDTGSSTETTDTTSKGDTTSKDDTSSAKGSDSTSTAKGDSTTKSSDAKKDSGTKDSGEKAAKADKK